MSRPIKSLWNFIVNMYTVLLNALFDLFQVIARVIKLHVKCEIYDDAITIYQSGLNWYYITIITGYIIRINILSIDENFIEHLKLYRTASEVDILIYRIWYIVVMFMIIVCFILMPLGKIEMYLTFIAVTGDMKHFSENKELDVKIDTLNI